MSLECSLANKKCVPCHGGVPPLADERVHELLLELGGGWQLNAAKHLERVYAFPDFAGALAFANRAGAIAEEEGHHPELHVAWGACRVELYTYAIDGLAESDFFLAAKISRVVER